MMRMLEPPKEESKTNAPTPPPMEEEQETPERTIDPEITGSRKTNSSDSHVRQESQEVQPKRTSQSASRKMDEMSDTVKDLMFNKRSYSATKKGYKKPKERSKGVRLSAVKMK